jgi:hypothetical protein
VTSEVANAGFTEPINHRGISTLNKFSRKEDKNMKKGRVISKSQSTYHINRQADIRDTSTVSRKSREEMFHGVIKKVI